MVSIEENVAPQITEEEVLEKLRTEPLYLAWVIAQNNPEDVNAGLTGIGMGANPATPQEVMKALNEAVYKVDAQTIVDILSVDFNPNAGNETANYQTVMQTAQNELRHNGVLADMNFGDLFAENLAAFADASADFEGKEPFKRKKACTGCRLSDRDKRIRLAGLFIALVAVFLIIKYWK